MAGKKKLNIKDIEKGPKKLKVNWDNIKASGLLSKAKIEIALHPAKKKVILGAKSTGKSIIPMMKAAVNFHQDQYFNAFGFRKYKEQASSNLSSLFERAINMLERSGFDITLQFETRAQKKATYRLFHGRNMAKNQQFKYGSLDDPSGSTDGSAPGKGYTGLIVFDEPVVEADAAHPEKIPKRPVWDKDMEIIRDNINRYNVDEMNLTGRKDVYTETYFCMNNWGNHPLVQDIDEVLTEDEFIQWVFGYDLEELLQNEELIEKLWKDEKWIARIKQNNTMSRYVEKTDTLYSRMTKFANPNNWDISILPNLMKQIKKALLEGDKSMLTILIGTKTIPEPDKEMLVFNIDDYNVAKLEPFIEKGFEVSHINYSWDIDTSRVLTCTPTLVLTKKHISGGLGVPIATRLEKYIYVDNQIELSAWGSGAYGEVNDLYVQQMVKATDTHYQKIPGIKTQRITISVDDKRKWFLNEMRKIRKPYMKMFRPFEQHGDWDTEGRQDLISLGFSNKSIFLHPGNTALMNDMDVIVKRDINDPRRKTSGNTNYLDRLDSMENGVIPYAPIIWKKGKN